MKSIPDLIPDGGLDLSPIPPSNTIHNKDRPIPTASPAPPNIHDARPHNPRLKHHKPHQSQPHPYSPREREREYYPVSTPAFVPRENFDVSPNILRPYFLGHHASALSSMRNVLSRISFVIEARDYRIPLTSLNPELDRALQGRPRIIVYTKCDLVFRSPEREGRLRQWHLDNNHADAVLFHSDPLGGKGMSGHTMRSTKRLLDAIKSLKVRSDDNPVLGTRGLVVGMPNSGKSTLLNLLRSAGMKGRVSAGDKGTKTVLRGGKRITVHKKAQKTAPQPGVTRKMSGPIRILPRSPAEQQKVPPSPAGGGEERDRGQETGNDCSPGPRARGPKKSPMAAEAEALEDAGVLILDTPGVFIPSLRSPASMLKLALAGTIKDTLVHEEIVADYLLYRLNLETPRLYGKLCPAPTNDVNVWLEKIARRTGKLGKGGSLLTDAAASWMISQWRTGWLGKFQLDELDGEGGEESLEEAQREKERPPRLSVREARIKMAGDRRERAASRMSTGEEG
ncbi:mitochondrial GTPase [Zalerion maritima]|uniref:Mitochondrial GTPase n=1 Tax=Zalerion maritima TaxID=339359 RepID=A0AAD5RMD2_9PEZI|nr:mitochondrial GTPase [Zalerion maritima]